VQVSPHVTPLREKAKALGLTDFRVEKLDLRARSAEICPVGLPLV
jgi:hypothetical protein